MASGQTIATAWIKVLPSLEGLQAALVRQSKGAVIEPTVRPAKNTASVFASSAASLGPLFSNTFGKTSAPSLTGSMKNILNSFTSEFSNSGKRSGQVFTQGFSGSIGPQGVGGYLKIGAATAGVAMMGQAVGRVGSMLVGMGNEWASIIARVQNAVGSTGDWNEALRSTRDAASEIGINMGDLADQSARLRLLAPETIKDYGTAVKFTSLLNKNMIATGASSEEAASATRQITQALGKGIVNGDELNSILENAPQIARMLAEHLHVGVGELKEMGKKGKITGDDLRDSVLENAQKINDEFAKMPLVASRAAKMVANYWNLSMSQTATKMSVTFGNALKSLVTGGYVEEVATGLTAQLDKVADHLGPAMENLIGQFGPHVQQAFAEINLNPFFDKINAVIDRIGQVSFIELLNGLKLVGVVGTVAFSGVLGGVDTFLGKIPVLGKALVNLRKGLIGALSSVGTAGGEAIGVFGRLIDKTGDWAMSIKLPVKEMKKVDDAFSGFKRNLKGVDFSQTDKGFQRVLKNMTNSAETVETRLAKMNKYLDDNAKKFSYTKIPPSFFKELDILEGKLKELDTTGTDTASRFKINFAQIGQNISDIVNKSWALNIRFDTGTPQAQLTQFRLDIIKDLSLIHIPDFLKEPIASMVAVAVNTIHRFGIVATGVFQLIGRGASNIFAETQAIISRAGGVLGPAVKNLFTNMFDPIQRYFAETTGMMFGDLARSITSKYGNMLVSAVTGVVNTVGSKVSGAVGFIRDKFNSVADDKSNPFSFMFQNIREASQLTSKYVAKVVPEGFSRMAGMVGRSVSNIGSKFPALKNVAVAAFRGIANAATTILGGTLKGIGAAVKGVGKAFSGLTHFVSSLGVTTAATTALTSAVSAMFHMNPQDLGKGFDDLNNKMTGAMKRFTEMAPQIARAFMDAAPEMVAAITASVPGLVAAFGDVVKTLAQVISDNLPSLLQAVTSGLNVLVGLIPTVLPVLLDAVVSLFTSLVSSLPAMFSVLGNAIIALIPVLADFFADGLPTMIQAIGDMMTQIGQFLPNLVENIAAGLPALFQAIADALPGEISTIMSGLLQLVTGILQSLPTIFPVLIQGVTTLLVGLVNAIPQFINTLMPMIPAIVKALSDTLVNSIDALIQGAIQLVNALVENLPTIITTLVQYIPQIINSLVDAFIDNLDMLINGSIQLVMALVEALPTIIEALINAIPQVIMTLGSAIVNNFPKIIKAFGDGFVAVASALPQLIGAVIQAIPRILGDMARAFGFLGDRIKDNIGNVPGKIMEVFQGAGNWLVDAGHRILDGLLAGLKSAWKGVTDFVGGIGDWIVQHKGPPAYDKIMLVRNGQLIMNGLYRGMADGFIQVQDFIGDVNHEIMGVGLRDPLYNVGSLKGSNMGYAVGAYNGSGKVVNQTFPAKIIRRDDDLYTAYPQLQRIAMNEASAV